MARQSAFDRDFHNLHGNRVEAVQIGPGRYRAATPRRRVDNLGLRLVVGSLGLFWAIVIGVALVAMLTVAGIAAWSVIATFSQSIPT